MSQPTQQEVDRVIAGYENAKEAPNYAASIVVEMQQLSGDDYGMVWSTKYPEEA